MPDGKWRSLISTEGRNIKTLNTESPCLNAIIAHSRFISSSFLVHIYAYFQ